jgi:hypothetical protein
MAMTATIVACPKPITAMPIAVTAGTGDKLKLANSAGSTSVTYDVIILGTE